MHNQNLMLNRNILGLVLSLLIASTLSVTLVHHSHNNLAKEMTQAFKLPSTMSDLKEDFSGNALAGSPDAKEDSSITAKGVATMKDAREDFAGKAAVGSADAKEDAAIKPMISSVKDVKEDKKPVAWSPSTFIDRGEDTVQVALSHKPSVSVLHKLIPSAHHNQASVHKAKIPAEDVTGAAQWKATVADLKQDAPAKAEMAAMMAEGKDDAAGLAKKGSLDAIEDFNSPQRTVYISMEKDGMEDWAGKAKKGSKDAKEDYIAKMKQAPMMRDVMEDSIASVSSTAAKDGREDTAQISKPIIKPATHITVHHSTVKAQANLPVKAHSKAIN